MSWPQWQGGGVPQPGVVQPPIINPAPNVVNPAASLMSTNQYTPEQWAQMQQQNWQQWAQWQQQFQQWQQQYGAEYQKSMTALAQTRTAPVQPPFFSNTAPPLPTETKPPPPPDDPQIEQLNSESHPPQPFTSAPPSVPQSNFNNPPPHSYSTPTREKFPSKFNPNQTNNPPSSQGSFSNYNSSETFKSGNQQQGGNFSNNRRSPGRNTNWQNQNNRNQSGFNNRFNQPSAEIESRNEFGIKRPYNQPSIGGDLKRNKIDANPENSRWRGNQQRPRWGEVQSHQTENQQWDTKQTDAKSNPEELTEAEKKFDKQFADWESQFQKWKEQNANHPDKEQYREYEKKWEAWRNQLLDRREQMRRKRLGLVSLSPQPVPDKGLQQRPEKDNLQAGPQIVGDIPFSHTNEKSMQGKPSPSQIGPQVLPPGKSGNSNILGSGSQITTMETPSATIRKPSLLETSSSNTGKLFNEQCDKEPPPIQISNANIGSPKFSRPPPNLNDQPLEFKRFTAELAENCQSQKVIPDVDTEATGFLKSATSEGIPGLDLVKDGKDDDKNENIKETHASQNPKPDLEAISRGINSILGDQKLMNMLSLVSQNQSRPTASAMVNTLSSIRPESPKFSPEDYSQEDYEDYSNQENANFYDNKRQNVFSNDEQTRSSFNIANDPDDLNKFNENSGRGFDNFDAKSNELSGDNVAFGQQTNRFNREASEPRGPGNWNRGFVNFNEGQGSLNRDPGSCNRGPNNFNRESERFNRIGGNSFNRGTDDFNEAPGTFSRDNEHWNRCEDDFNRDNENFDGEPDNFSRNSDNCNPEDFDKEPDHFCSNRGSNNFGRGIDNFNRGADTFNRGPNNFNRGPGNFNRGPDNFTRGSDNFNRGLDNFNRGPNNFNKGPSNFNAFNKGPDNLNRCLDNFSREPENFNRGPDNSNRGPDNFNKISDNFNKISDNFNKISDNFNKGSDNFKKGPDNFNRGSDNFNRGPDNFNRGPDNFNRGLDNFNRGPDNFNRGPDNFNRGSDNFTRGPDNINRGLDNFSRGPGPDNFNRGSDNFNRGPEDFSGGSENFNRNLDRFAEDTDNFNRNRGPNWRQDSENRDDENFQRSSVNNFNRESDTFNTCFEQGPKGYNVRRDHDNFENELDGANGRGPSNIINEDRNIFTREQNFDKMVFNREPDGLQSNEFQSPVEWNQSSSFTNDPASTQPSELPKVKNEKPASDEDMWKPKNVIDYDHKSSKPSEPDVILEPVYTFDYRHKPLNRIPYPQRPKWLSEMVKNYPEFDLIIPRPFEPHQLRIYPVNERFETYQKYDDRDKKNYDDRDRKLYDDRDRKLPEDRDRKLYDDRDRRIYETRDRKFFDRDRKIYEDPSRKPFDEKKPREFDDRRFSDDQKNFGYKKLYSKDSENLKFDGLHENTGRDKKPIKELKNKNEDNQQSGSERNLSSTSVPSNLSSKSNVTVIEDLLSPPGRFNRPPRLVVILRGPPGSGKSFLARLIKDKEVENGGSAPRILCLDDYFMVEQEKEIEEDGRKVKVKDMVYEYEECMEASYRQSLMKAFKKTITDGYFNFIIVDNINDKVKYFGEMWSFAKQNGFQVYICQMELDVQTCTKRNIHGRSEVEIERCVAGWEHTPSHHPTLDATSLIQSGSISEVEMEEINSPASENMNEEEHLITSKWDNFDYSVDNLAKLDGTNKPLRPSRTMEDYLQLDDHWAEPVSTKPGQKRVRWADLEERKKQEKMRAIGFVVGQTNWDRMLDPTMGSAALTQTKYIERCNKY